MALVIYPTDDYTSFCSIADADTLLTANLPATQHATWDDLSDANKEIYLRQATILIKPRITLPSTLEDDLELACAYLANYSIAIDMTNSDGKDNLQELGIDKGTIKKVWFSKGAASNSFPNIVQVLLGQYGYSASSLKIERK